LLIDADSSPNAVTHVRFEQRSHSTDLDPVDTVAKTTGSMNDSL